jgi:hypothetical protein
MGAFMLRRTFLQNTLLGSGLALAGMQAHDTRGSARSAYPFHTLSEAMEAAHFDPRAADSFTVVWAADIHYGVGNPQEILPPILHEIHRMSPPPAFFGIVGDLIMKASLHFGQIPDRQQRQEAIAEFRQVRQALAGLNPAIPLKLALGNHDTYPGEETPALFHAVFPEHPEIHAFRVGGVPFLFLNGGSSGLLSERQRAWLRSTVSRMHKPGNTLVLALHQPSLGRVTRERGVAAAVRDALAEVQGELWMVSGHEHCNQDACFQLPQSAITQATITTANPAMWGTEQPGYWVYGFARGHLTARIFRRLGQGYAVAPTPPRIPAHPLRLPFEAQEPQILWKVLVGEGDTPYFVEAEAAWCLNYWYDAKRLTYRFPLVLAGGEARQLAVLEEASNEKAERRYFLSPDGKDWQAVTPVERQEECTLLAIPKVCQAAGVVAVRLENCTVSGFALTR